MFDSDGLFLLVNPGGGKWWRFKYRFAGKEKLLSLGIYPEVALAGARGRRGAERRKLAEGIDPAINRKGLKDSWLESQGNSFEVVAREWIDQNKSSWSGSNTVKTTRRLEVDIFPWLGGSLAGSAAARNASVIQSEKARAGKQVRTDRRWLSIRCAIIRVCRKQKLKLVASDSFAESIKKDVLEAAKRFGHTDLTKRISTRSIERHIAALLKDHRLRNAILEDCELQGWL